MQPLHDSVFEAIAQAGYAGIEFKGVRVAENKRVQQALREYNFGFVSQIHTEGTTVADHLTSFRKLIEISLPFAPLLINSQGGADYWHLDDKLRFVEGTLRIAGELGVTVVHETHRSRITYTPWDTRDLLLQFPEMKICCDFSHWVNVCERLLPTETDILRLCARHCYHLHARVGYEQGPQVPDPQAPEYAAHLAAHLEWWRWIWEAQRARGAATTTFTPEFGPPLYHHILPYTQQPVSDVWKISEWMHTRLRQEFERFVAAGSV